MLRLLPARYYEAATTGTRRQIQPRSSSYSLWLKQRRTWPCCLLVCVLLCVPAPLAYWYIEKKRERNLILCQHYSCHDELKGAKPEKRLPLRIGSTTLAARELLRGVCA